MFYYKHAMIFSVVLFLLMVSILGPLVHTRSIVFAAEGDTYCHGTSKTTSSCVVSNDDGYTFVNCSKNKDGKTWNCHVVAKSEPTPPSGLKSAAVNAVHPTGIAEGGALTTGSNESGNNNTKAFNGGILLNSALKGGETTGNNTNATGIPALNAYLNLHGQKTGALKGNVSNTN